MSDAFTCKNFQIKRAPRLIQLLGDKKRPESAQHIIEFPGGAIELSRTSDGNYWAHIIINRGQVVEDLEGLYSARGVIIGHRIDRDDGVVPIEGAERMTQIAVLIKPEPA